MSIKQSNECPSCNQFVPNDTRYITLRNGKRYHEGCAKEIAEAYIKLSMKSDNGNTKQNKKYSKPQRTPQKKENNDSQANTSA